MSEHLRWYTKALYGMDHVVRSAPQDAEAWDRRSPCAEWSARDVLGHVIAVQWSHAARTDGAPAPMDPFATPGRHCGDDPAAAWAAARDAVLVALDRPGVLQRVVGSSRGEQTIDALIGFNIVDTTVHAWDLAQALGVDDRLDAGVATRAAELLAAALPGLQGKGYFADARIAPRDASPQDRLLALAGRTPLA